MKRKGEAKSSTSEPASVSTSSSVVVAIKSRVVVWRLEKGSSPSRPRALRRLSPAGSRRKGRRSVKADTSCGDSAVIIRQPSAALSALALETADVLDRFAFGDTWFGLVPSHLGRNNAVDDAARALIQAYGLASGRQHVTLDVCTQAYVRAISSTGKAMTTKKAAISDESLLAVALLTHFESMMGFCQGPGVLQATVYSVIGQVYTHVHGIYAIMMARSKASAMSELSRAIFVSHFSLLFMSPAAFGTPTPFDEAQWWDLEPVSHRSLPVDISTLRHLGHALMLRLPRLMALTRKGQLAGDKAALREARKLATDLLKLRDDSSESAALHRVAIRQSFHPVDALVVPYTMHFNKHADYEACIAYWQTRLTLLRLCRRLLCYEYTTPQQVNEEASRTARNIMMAWEYGSSQAWFGRSYLIYAMPVVWGALCDLEDISKVPKRVVRVWACERYRLLLGKWMPPAEVDYTHELSAYLEDIAEAFAGGELKGEFVVQNQLHWRSMFGQR